MNGLGTVYVAAVAAGAKLFQLLACPYDAMGATMATYCGQNVGAWKLDRLGQGIRACAWLGAGYAVLAFGGMLLFSAPCAMLFLDPAEPELPLLLDLTRRYIVTLTAFFFPLALVNIVRFSIQGMGYSLFAILAGVLEMIARTGVGMWLVPVFGYPAACFASPAAWLAADLFLIPASMLCVSRLRRLHPAERAAAQETAPAPEQPARAARSGARAEAVRLSGPRRGRTNFFSLGAANRPAHASNGVKGGGPMSHTSDRPADWEQLVHDNENRLYRAALAILGHPQEAEDAVQDAFVRYLERAPADLERPGAWLMRVLVNGCRSRLRLAWRRVGPLPDDLPAPGPEERLELEELWSLPPADRAVLHLYYYEGYSTEEIAR